MLKVLFAITRPIALCGVALGLCGCVAAVPLAQMAVSSMTTSPPCTTGPGCQTAVAGLSFSDFSKRFDQSMRMLTGTPANDQKAEADPPVK